MCVEKFMCLHGVCVYTFISNNNIRLLKHLFLRHKGPWLFGVKKGMKNYPVNYVRVIKVIKKKQKIRIPTKQPGFNGKYLRPGFVLKTQNRQNPAIFSSVMLAISACAKSCWVKVPQIFSAVQHTDASELHMVYIYMLHAWTFKGVPITP